MRSNFLLLIGVVVVFHLGANSWGKEGWNQKMKQLSEILPELVVDVHSQKRFHSPKVLKRVKKNTALMADLAHEMSRVRATGRGMAAAIDADPSIVIFSSLFAQEVKRAQMALDNGHHDYARRILMSVSSNCMHCHTRHDIGPKFPKIAIRTDTKELTRFERADLFVALRQFDAAFGEYQKIVSDKKVAANLPVDWEKAVRKSLLLSIRVQKEPKRALSVVNGALESPHASMSFKSEALAWKEALTQWSQEPRRKEVTATGYLMEGKRLLAQARKQQLYPADNSGDIYFMRATEKMHTLLRQKLNNKQLAEAFFIAGISYEGLRDVGLVEVPEVYYETCVRRAPHTEIAGKCFARYEKNIQLGYSGSSGIHLPFGIKRTLNELKGLSNKK